MTQFCVVNCGLPAEQCTCYGDRFKTVAPAHQYESRANITAEELQEMFGEIIPVEVAVEIIKNSHLSPAEMRLKLRSIASNVLISSDNHTLLLGSEAGTDFTSPCCNDAVTAIFLFDTLEGFRCESCGHEYADQEDLCC